MIDSKGFSEWLSINSDYSAAVIGDIVCRAKRADKIKEWDNTETYIFYLERSEQFKNLSVSVKSQIRKAVNLYCKYSLK